MHHKVLISILLSFLTFYAFSQSTASVNVNTFELETGEDCFKKKIWIYLPAGYEKTDKHYPVIYMHDAQNLFDKETSYVGEWQIDESLDSIQEPKAIIVGIEHGGEKRIDELTPFPHENYGGGKGDAYVNFIVRTLKPYIDENYRTLKDQSNTGIFGSSLGGLISYYAALKYPDIFGKVGVYSPSFWFNEKIYDLTKETQFDNTTKFYFLVGTEESDEMVPDLKRMVKILNEKGLDPAQIQTKIIEGGKHNESMWAENFTESYLWLMKN
ncbi:alpha/beta hydrolase [Christiangramia aquimixticola]|uniref:alpha/beta hydrolase n=1 Tax=Christiangramia aquimixticola TaxID=1697558 RepID=UPI003AA8F0F3